MVLAVYLDRQLVFVNHEIRNEWTHRRLPADMDPVQAADLTQRTPELAFALRHVAT